MTIDSGIIEPILETSDSFNVGTTLTKKTRLIMDGNNITRIYDDGIFDKELHNHRLKLNDNSNYQECPLFKAEYILIKLRSKITEVIQPYKQSNCFLKRHLQTIFRKSHISVYDLMDLHAYLAKRILPKIIAYKKEYLAHGGGEFPDRLFQDVQSSDSVALVLSDTGELTEEEKAWVGVIDEIIFAMRWLLESGHPMAKEGFYNEYYGAFVPYEDNKDKYFEQISTAEKRAQKGFELFGKFFTSFWY